MIKPTYTFPRDFQRAEPEGNPEVKLLSPRHQRKENQISLEILSLSFLCPIFYTISQRTQAIKAAIVFDLVILFLFSLVKSPPKSTS